MTHPGVASPSAFRLPAPPAWVFHGVFFLPSLVMVGLSQSSMAAGLMLYFVGLCLYFAADEVLTGASKIHRRFLWRSILLAGTLLISVLMHAGPRLISASSFNASRFFGSYLVLALMLLAAAGFAHRVARLPEHTVSKWVTQALYFLVLNALLGLTGIQLFAKATIKPVGIFSEPSHLALILAPLLTYACATEARHHRLLLIFFFGWGLAIENLTTLVAVTLCFLVTLRLNWSILAVLVAVAVGVALVDVEYFVSRLIISSDSDNLSVLVLLQGWENALLMLRDTGGWGAGFQQFGFLNVAGDFSDRLALLGEDSLNLLDGGSTASKLVGEFGLFGVAALAIYVPLFLHTFFKLRRVRKVGGASGELLLIACLFTFAIELFARGVGYFSPTCFLALSAMIALACSARSNHANP